MTARAGLGIDLLEIDRIEQALERRPALATRLFTETELSQCGERARPARHLAARFCAKEAVIKALALDSCAMTDIEIVGGGRRPPQARLSGKAEAAARSRGVTVLVSLAHNRHSATAVATLVEG